MSSNNSSGEVCFLQIDLNSLKCPISRAIMLDPVIAMDGHTYEREQMTVWLLNNQRSPVTNERIQSHLIPNHQLKALINALYDNNVDAYIEEQYQSEALLEPLTMNFEEAGSPTFLNQTRLDFSENRSHSASYSPTSEEEELIPYDDESEDDYNFDSFSPADEMRY